MKKKDKEKENNIHDDQINEVIDASVYENNEIGDEVNNEQDDTSEEVKKESKADQSEAKIAELQDRYLRLSAEFDNYRKRTLKEKMELTQLAGEDILKSLLPFMDDFERAQKSMSTTDNVEALRDGLSLILTKFKDFLTQKQIKEIPAEKLDFDADLHEAITKIPVQDSKLKGKVVDVIEKGYYLHDKIIRYAKVVVGE